MSVPIFAPVHQAGKESDAIHQYVSRNVRMGVSVLALTHASAPRNGKGLSARAPCVITSVYMAVDVSHPTYVPVALDTLE